MAIGKCAASMKVFAAYANRTPQAKELLSDWNRIVEFELRGEDPFHIRIENGESVFAEGAHPKPQVTFRGDAESFYSVIAGTLDADEAYTTKKLEIIGSIMDATKFRRIGEITQNAHEDVFTLLKEIAKIIW